MLIFAAVWDTRANSRAPGQTRGLPHRLGLAQDQGQVQGFDSKEVVGRNSAMLRIPSDPRGYGHRMTVVEDRQFADPNFAIEDMWIEVFSSRVCASGFGQVGDGRSFAFQVERQRLEVEIYRPRLTGPVPQAEDVVATSSRDLANVDFTDERSLTAAVRDAVAVAEPVPR